MDFCSLQDMSYQIWEIGIFACMGCVGEYWVMSFPFLNSLLGHIILSTLCSDSERLLLVIIKWIAREVPLWVKLLSKLMHKTGWWLRWMVNGYANWSMITLIGQWLCELVDGYADGHFCFRRDIWCTFQRHQPEADLVPQQVSLLVAGQRWFYLFTLTWPMGHFCHGKFWSVSTCKAAATELHSAASCLFPVMVELLLYFFFLRGQGCC